MRILLLALIALTLPGLAFARSGDLPGAEAVLDRDVDFIVVGEVHGTVELPAVFADMVRLAAARDRPMIVAIEHTPESLAGLDAYMASDGGAEARRRLALDAPGWKMPDGRMFELVEAARALKAGGADVRLVAFDHWIESGTNERREAAMAANLVAAWERVPGAQVLVLTGLGHADATGFTSAEPPFRSMVQFLPAERTLSLAFVRSGGETWGCRRPEATLECLPVALTARDAPAARGIVLTDERAGFDGIVSTGAPFTASRPFLSQ